MVPGTLFGLTAPLVPTPVAMVNVTGTGNSMTVKKRNGRRQTSIPKKFVV